MLLVFLNGTVVPSHALYQSYLGPRCHSALPKGPALAIGITPVLGGLVCTTELNWY